MKTIDIAVLYGVITTQELAESPEMRMLVKHMRISLQQMHRLNKQRKPPRTIDARIDLQIVMTACLKLMCRLECIGDAK